MNESNWQSKITSCLVLALSFAVVANIVWTLIEPLIIPAAFVVVGLVVLVNLLRWWKRKNFW